MKIPSRRVLLVVVALLIAGVAAVVALGSAGSTSGDRASRTEAASPTQSAQAGPSGRSEAPKGSCTGTAPPFKPRTIVIADVTRGASVIAPPRDSRGVPGIPPRTEAGKSVFAWDSASGIRPGDPAGNVLLNAHTWPDGSALGNRMLAELHRGDRIVVRGSDTKLCYRVTERVEVPASEGLRRYYSTDGPPQLAIVVCSGRRLAPGVWENRTVWFASPVGG